MYSDNPFSHWTVIGHRGASGTHPENTLPAFKRCAEIGLQWVECDLHLTQDEEVVIIHDATLNRTTTGQGPVEDHSLEAIQQFDAGAWFDQKFQGVSVPTLREFLEMAQALGLRVNLELKSASQGDRLVEKTLSTLNQFFTGEATHTALPLLTSFSIDLLQKIHDTESRWPLGLLLSEWRPDWESFADALHCVSVHCDNDWVQPWQINAIRRTNRGALIYTVDDPKRAQELQTLQASGIFTNQPESVMPGPTL